MVQIREAVLAGRFKQDSPEWHEFRAGVIGSSDVASVLGVGFKSAYTLWHEKRGLIEPRPVDPKMKRKYAYGHHMEPFVVDIFNQEHPDLQATIEDGSWYHEDRTWQGCNPDSLVWQGGGGAAAGAPLGCAELKTFPSLADWQEGPPQGYIAQLLWQVDTFGFTGGWLSGYANLSGDYVDYYYEADPFTADAVRAQVRAFFDSDTPPEIDGSLGTYETIRRLNPSLDRGREVAIPDEIAERYLAAAADYKTADSELNKWKGHLLAHMGTAQYATYGSKKIASRVAGRGDDPVPYLKEQ
jgi:YqaJ-like viral recombinase domain